MCMMSIWLQSGVLAFEGLSEADTLPLHLLWVWKLHLWRASDQVMGPVNH